MSHCLMSMSGLVSRYLGWKQITRLNWERCNDRPHFIQVFTMMQPHGPLLCFRLLHIFNGSVSASLVGHILYSADFMSAICIPHLLLMVHRYIYSRYSSVFLMLYVTNFIWPYLHQFFIDSHSLNNYGKPLKRPFDKY